MAVESADIQLSCNLLQYLQYSSCRDSPKSVEYARFMDMSNQYRGNSCAEHPLR